MSTKVASLYAEITADTTGLENGLKKSKTQLTQAQNGLNSTAKSADGLGGALGNLINPATIATGAITALTAFIKSSIKEASEAAKIDAKLGAVIKSTGGLAGMTTKSIDQLSTAKSKMTGIDDEVIKNSSAVMLTFTQVGKEVFPDAMQAAIDMSAVMGGDLQGSVTMLGKALNVTAGDVAAANMGMTALRRNGVSFTDEQKEMAKQMIQVGDVAGYQRLILAELAKEFGGASQAMFEAGDRSEAVKNSWSNYKEAIGSSLLPAQQKFNSLLSNTLDAVTENIQANQTQTQTIQEVGQAYGWNAVQIGNAIRHTNNLSAAQQAQVDEYKRLQQYGAAWANVLDVQNQKTQEAEVDNEALYKGALVLTKTQRDYKSALEQIDKTLKNGDYLRQQYKAQQEEIHQQEKDGIITKRQEQQALVSLNQAWANGSFQMKEQNKLYQQLEISQQAQNASFVSGLLEEQGATAEMKINYAQATGQITEDAANQYKALTRITEAQIKNGLSADRAAQATRLVGSELQKASGMTANMFIDVWIRTHGSTSIGTDISNPFAGRTTLQTANLTVAPGGPPAGHAAGGKNIAKGVFRVGEKGEEGMVYGPDGSVDIIPNDVWGEMKKWGVYPEAGFAGGGAVGGHAATRPGAGSTRKRVISTTPSPKMSLPDSAPPTLSMGDTSNGVAEVQAQQTAQAQTTSNNQIAELLTETNTILKKQATKNDLASLYNHGAKTQV